MRFNILQMVWPNGVCRHRLYSTLLRAYTHAELSAALVRCGFAGVKAYGGPRLGAFSPSRSQTLMLVARR